jgi:uroporphyrinogen-III synthase
MTGQPIYLLSTGTLPEGPVEEAANAGVTLDAVPFIGIEYPDGMEEIETLFLQPLTVVFTSVNAVNAVARWIHKKPDWRVYCISGATFGAVVRLFGEKAVRGKAGSAAELAEVIREREAGKTGELVFFCGDQRREDLPALGVTEKIVYRTVLTPQKVARTYDGIAFFSPSAVESFFSVNVIAGGIPLFVIGPTTEAAIRARCTNPVITGEEPDKVKLVRQMTDHFLNKR